MQALHEAYERVSEATAAKTEMHKLLETELTIMHGHVCETQKRLQEIQQRYQEEAKRTDFWRTEYLGELTPYNGPPPEPEEQKELRQLAKVENEIMGLPDPALKKTIDAMKMAAQADFRPETSANADKVRLKAEVYKLVTGRAPTEKEISRWMGSK